MSDDEQSELRREVQRLLGCCMLRLKQYERLLKAILAHHELAGPAHQLESLQSARVDDFATNTLGGLVTALFESYVVVQGANSAALDETKLPADLPWLSFRRTIEMSEERFTQTKSSLKELVSLRNDLVHHFIEKFDVWTTDGCVMAHEHLLESYARIDECFEELRNWTMSPFQSEAYWEFVVNGIEPDGTFEWAEAGIVQALKDAINVKAVGGWTPLEDAVRWVAKYHPEQLPEKYGCRTWTQVLSDSRMFQWEYRETVSEPKVAWFRLRDTGH